MNKNYIEVENIYKKKYKILSRYYLIKNDLYDIMLIPGQAIRYSSSIDYLSGSYVIMKTITINNLIKSLLLKSFYTKKYIKINIDNYFIFAYNRNKMKLITIG